MSVGVEVDALALMLDGAMHQGLRFNEINIESLESGSVYGGQTPLLERAVAQSRWAEVAEAILELEGLADCWDAGGHSSIDDDIEFPPWGCLAFRAALHADGWMSTSVSLREAAALLRDGWRPGGES